jgi:two-component system, cell cycle sensor histidine kinase and response regulator CckA
MRSAVSEERVIEERYRQLLESLPHGVGMIVQGEIRFANRAALKMFGWDRPEEVLGDALVPLADGEVTHVLAQIAALRKGESEGPVHYFARGRHRAGHSIPLEVFVSRVTYGEEDALQVFMIDLSERHREEQKRAELEEQLRQTRRMESLGRLAGGIAHDLNNLLVPILSLSQLALEELEPSHPLRTELQTIHAAAERGSRLTGQLLAFGRKQVLNLRVLDVNTVIGESEKLLKRLLPENISVALALGPPAVVRADSAQLHQVLVSLVVNARDALRRGGEVTIRTRTEAVGAAPEAGPLAGLEPGEHVILEVSDDGSGMDAETLSRAFEPFYTTKGTGQGVGLGLATVHGIVTQHGGRVVLESTVGKGTTARIYLPRVAAAVEEVRRPEGRTDEVRAGGTVLVAEDEVVVRQVACRILRHRGLNVIEARDGEEALFLAARQTGPIHVLLTDLIMPHMDGAELAQRLTQRRPETVVVFMSGYTDDVIARHGVADEGVLFVQKPFTMESLLAKVEEALRCRYA